jgi:hypothetical protein
MADRNYVIMLRESLEKKIEVLQEIHKENLHQKEVLENPLSTPDELKETIDRKDKLIDVINALDDGFQQMYDRVKDILSTDKASYSDEISKMQTLISELTALSATVQAEELRNKDLATAKFARVRSQAKKLNSVKGAVNSYTQNMGKLNVVDPQFLDKKN